MNLYRPRASYARRGVAAVRDPGVVGVLVPEVLAYRGWGFAAGRHLR